MPDLPPYVPWQLVSQRLPVIFPEGTPRRGYCVRELSASTVFTMLYIGAVEGADRFLSPKHVYRMTDEQAERSDATSREAYGADVLRAGFIVPGARWYADNTREPIRDESLREGLVAIGAVIARTDLPTTSSKPRYALRQDFAALFDPALDGDSLQAAISAWQTANLSVGALARVAIMRHGAIPDGTGVLVTFPNGETRRLAPGPSSIIAQAVIETFASRFLEQPAVLWLSESGNKVVARDDALATAIGLRIEADRNLPDIILVELARPEPILIFVEVVATDGAITPRRREALRALTEDAGFSRAQVAFLTAYLDRESAGFRRTFASLAWGSFAWLASEPDHIVILRDGVGRPERLHELLGLS